MSAPLIAYKDDLTLVLMFIEFIKRVGERDKRRGLLEHEN